MAAPLAMMSRIALADGFRSNEESDRIDGLAGDDDLFGRGDGGVDRVSCGSGRDVVRANPEGPRFW